MDPVSAHCHLGLGKLYRRAAQPEKAREHLAGAQPKYRAMGMTYWRAQVQAETAELGNS